MYSPLTGTVVASNEAVEGKPGLVNSSPEEDGWLFRVLLEEEQEVVLPTAIKSIQKSVCDIGQVCHFQVAGLMAAEQYQKFLSSQTEDLS